MKDVSFTKDWAQCLVGLLFLMGFSASGAAQPVVMHVKDGTGCTDCQTCGASWATAFDEISDAIACASTQDSVELWVAECTYGLIALRNNMKIIGGFEGDEASASESDPHRNRSIITGGDHLILSTGNDSTAVLRGFYIQNGGTLSNYESGPGLYLQAFSSPVIADRLQDLLKAIITA